MSAHLLVKAAGPTVMLTAVLGIGAAVNALTSVLRTWIEQMSRTRRLINDLIDRAEVTGKSSRTAHRSAGSPDDYEGVVSM